MIRNSSPSRETLRRFDDLVERILVRLFGSGIPIISWEDASTIMALQRLFVGDIGIFTWENAPEALTQLLSLSHLDLAVRSPNHVPWRKRLKTSYVHRFPHFCMEHFLVETVSTPQKLLDLLDFLLQFNFGVLELFFFCKLNMFDESWFRLFEKAIFEKISEKDDVQKTLIIRRYLRALERSTLSPGGNFHAAMPTLLEHCTYLDVGLTIDILSTFCYSRFYRLWLFNVAPNGKCLERLILQAKAIGFDFWGLWREEGDFFLDIFNLKQENSKILLQYAFPYRTDQATFSRRCDTLSYVKIGGRKIIQSVNVFTHEANAEKRTRMMLIRDTFIIFGDFHVPADFNDRVNTLIYLTRTLSLPYVTTTELEETLLEAVIPDFQNDLREIVSKYENAGIFEDDVNTLRPRRLMHLCRVVIRKRLVDNHLFMDGIEQLNIPALFKEYLKLER